MQQLQQVMKVATKVAGSTSGMNTWRMPTLSALVYQLRSSALSAPPAARVAAMRRLRSLGANPVGRFGAGGADIDREQSDDAGHHDRRAPTPGAGDEPGDGTGKRGAKAPGGPVDADHPAAQMRGPSLGNEHRTERPLAVGREGQQRAPRQRPRSSATALRPASSARTSR